MISSSQGPLYLATHNTHDRHPCPRWDSNPQSQQASGRSLRPSDHRDRPIKCANSTKTCVFMLPICTDNTVSCHQLKLLLSREQKRTHGLLWCVNKYTPHVYVWGNKNSWMTRNILIWYSSRNSNKMLESQSLFNPYVTNVIYIYGAPILDVSRSHTTTQHSR